MLAGALRSFAEYYIPVKGVQTVQLYRWKAIDRSGKTFSGVYAAATRADAAAYVRGNYGYLTQLHAQKPAARFTLFKADEALTDGEKAIFFGQLALMLESGLPVLTALKILEERLPRKAAQTCRYLQRSLQNGESLAQAAEGKKQALGSLAAAVITAGEDGAILCEMLAELSAYYQLQAQMKRFIKNISLYPLFLLTASLATALLFMLKVLPLFKDLYASMGAELPLYLRLLFAVQEGFAAANLPLLLCAGMLVFAAAVHYRQRLIKMLFAVPALTTYRRLYLEIRFNKVLSLLLSGGMALPAAACLAGEALGDALLKKEAESFAADVLRGSAPAEAAMRAKNLFGSLSVEFIGVGAETGRLPEMLNRAAELLSERFDDTLKKLKVVLEPLLLVLVAAVVSAVILAVAAPMFTLSGALPQY